MKAVHEYKSCIKAMSFVDDDYYKPPLEGERLWVFFVVFFFLFLHSSEGFNHWKLGCCTFGVEKLEKVLFFFFFLKKPCGRIFFFLFFF